MSRVWKIALREYLSLLRTPGFWISLVVTPAIIAFLALGGPKAVQSSAPPPRVTVIDLSGSGLGLALNGALAGHDIAARVTPSPPARTEVEAAERLRTAVAAPVRAPGALDLAVLALGRPSAIRLQVWSRGFGDPVVLAAIEGAAAARMRSARLAAYGLSPSLLRELDTAEPAVETMPLQDGAVTKPSPMPNAAEGQYPTSPIPAGTAVNTAIVQGMVIASALLLWAMIFTGSGLLLNSVIEERSGRILEVLMSCASIPEILAGKIIGMAALSGTTFMTWGLFSFALSTFIQHQALGPILSAALAHGLLVFFLLFFLAGYLMYAAVFAAIGVFCETPREAQALLGPLTLLTGVPIIFLALSVERPDAPIITILSWLPPFTPFLMTARIAGGLPVWQAVLALAMMAATAAVVVWLAGRAFTAGALSGGKLDLKALLAGAAHGAG